MKRRHTESTIDGTSPCELHGRCTKWLPGWIEAAYGDPAEACRHSADLEQRHPRSSVVVAIRSLALARAGELSAARALLPTLTDRSRFAAPNCALTCVAWQQLGEPDAALRALEAAAETREPWIGVMLTDPINEPLRQHPAFKDLERTVFSQGS